MPHTCSRKGMARLTEDMVRNYFGFKIVDLACFIYSVLINVKYILNLIFFLMQKMQSDDPSSICRSKVWIKSRIRKNGEPVNKDVADVIVRVFDYLLSY